MLVRKKYAWLLLIAGIGILFKVSVVNASEIQAMGFLGAEGQVNFDYLTEDNYNGEVDAVGNPTGSSNGQERQVTQQNLELLFHTFIYHPNFLKFDFGFGLVFTQNDVTDFNVQVNDTPPPQYTETVVDNSNNSNALDLNFRLSFFEKKDYPFSLFYVRKHPSINAVTADAFISESTRYGANFVWNAPIKLTLDAIHYDVSGESNLRVVSDKVDATTLGAYKSFKNDGRAQLLYSHQVQVSNSGSTVFARTPTRNTIDSLNFDVRTNYGDKREYTFNLFSSYRQNRDSFEYDEIMISPSIEWIHNEHLKSNYTYSYNSNIYADLQNDTHTANAGIAYTEFNGFSTRFDVTALQTQLSGANSTLYGIKNSTSYRHMFKHATFSITMLIGANESNSEVTAPTSESNEEINMPDKTGEFVRLASRNILSPEKGGYIQVTSTIEKDPDTGLLRVYDEGDDYNIYDRGNGQFDIERNSKSLLLNAGHPVLIEYLIDHGSDNRFRRTIKGLNSTVQFLEYFNVFAGINESDVTILEGTVSDTLVTNRTATNSGAGVDFPLWDDRILMGGEVRLDNTKENAVVTEAKSALGYMQISVFRGGSLYLSRRDSTVEYTGIVGSFNNIDKIDYRALLKYQTTRRTNLSLIYDESTDVGNINEIKELQEASIRFEWGYRRILLNITGSKLNDLRGTQLRERTAVQLNLVRTF